MAIAPTGDIYKALVFDGESSRSYGVYITGEAVYNAPERDVEMISIPGRNGSYALDHGRFQNIEVTYPAGIFADDETNFADAISDFRNFLCSRKGYVRLTDEYNPNEYRMAVYKSGLEVSPAQLKAGEFSITFECKPQRWLTSGETEVSLSDGESITNPTLFDASPLLEVEGYGTIGFNGYAIELNNSTLGNVTMASAQKFTPSGNSIANFSFSFAFDDNSLNTGDTFSFNIESILWHVGLNGWLFNYPITWQSVSDSNADATTTFNTGQNVPDRAYNQGGGSWTNGYAFTTVTNAINFLKGTAKTWTNVATLPSTPIVKNGDPSTTDTFSATLTVSVVYDGTNSKFTINISVSTSDDTLLNTNFYCISWCKASSITGVSTVSQLGSPTYIDCDLGEVYMIKDGSPVSLNQYVDLGSDLPVLSPGSNTIAYDNTITDFKIVPNWWKV